MLIAGAGGHALEILDLFFQKKEDRDLCFFDNKKKETPGLIFDKFPVLRSAEEVRGLFRRDSRFVLGVGDPAARFILSEKLRSYGGKLESAVASSSRIGGYGVVLEDGLNIMNSVIVTNDVFVGEGVLLNAQSTIHHGVRVGKYSEISPGVHILGHARIGDFCRIGAGAVILPHVTIGNKAVVGAGAVVTKNVDANTKVAGVPAKPL